MEIPPDSLSKHLKRQLIFLRNSASAYDAGCIEEAVRIAVVVRILCYDKKHKSLLTQMGLKASIQLVTTAKMMASEQFVSVDYAELMSGITFGHTISFDPVSKSAPTVSCPEWWVQPIFYRNGKNYTREDLVLAAAHKDGGAHVGEPDSDLIAFKEGFWIKTTTSPDGTTLHTPLENNHFRMLRRIADELLASPELIDAASY
jgi:hypothetical protein